MSPPIRLIAALALALLVAPLVAAAGPQQKRPAGPPIGAMLLLPAGLLFVSFDANGDRRMDQAELLAGLDRAFAEADRDVSGALSPLEYADWAEAALGDRDAHPARVAVNPDQDLIVTRAEFRAAFLELAASYGVTEAESAPFSKFVSRLDVSRPRAQPCGPLARPLPNQAAEG